MSCTYQDVCKSVLFHRENSDIRNLGQQCCRIYLRNVCWIWRMIAPVRLPLRVAPGHRQAVTAPQQAKTIWLVRMFSPNFATFPLVGRRQALR
jgi:hypothetical protein